MNNYPYNRKKDILSNHQQSLLNQFSSYNITFQKKNRAMQMVNYYPKTSLRNFALYDKSALCKLIVKIVVLLLASLMMSFVVMCNCSERHSWLKSLVVRGLTAQECHTLLMKDFCIVTLNLVLTRSIGVDEMYLYRLAYI